MEKISIFLSTHFDEIRQLCRQLVIKGLGGNLDAANDVSQEVFLALLDPERSLNFPVDDKVLAFKYIKKTARNFWFALIKQQRPMVEMKDESYGDLPYEEPDEQETNRLPGIEALQALNKRIIERNMLSKAQLDLWTCILKMTPKREIMEKLGLSSTLVNNYKNKLFVIIRKNFNQKDYM